MQYSVTRPLYAGIYRCIQVYTGCTQVYTVCIQVYTGCTQVYTGVQVYTGSLRYRVDEQSHAGIPFSHRPIETHSYMSVSKRLSVYSCVVCGDRVSSSLFVPPPPLSPTTHPGTCLHGQGGTSQVCKGVELYLLRVDVFSRYSVCK